MDDLLAGPKNAGDVAEAPVGAVRRELARLGRGWAAAQGRDLAVRLHLVLLLLVATVALASRIAGPFPVLGSLEGQWGPALAVGLALFLVGPVVGFLVEWLIRPRSVPFARRLDDGQGWGDATDTALGLPDDRGCDPVEAFLAAQTAGRLRTIAPSRVWPRRPAWVWPRRILVLVFLFALLGPGCRGGIRGAGQGDPDGLGSHPDGNPEDPIDADRWLREHALLTLEAPDPEGDPLALEVRLVTDRPLPAPYGTDLVLDWDGVPVLLDPPDVVPEGEVARRTIRLRLDEVEDLESRLVPGRHVARARLVPREGPWTADLPSNELIIHLEPRDGTPPPEPTPDPEPTPEPEPPPEDEPPPSETPGEAPAPTPPDDGRVEVVDPLVRDDGETVRKKEAVVAVPHPEAGLNAPQRVPLDEALGDFDRILERAMGSERVRPADRAFLLRYFEALRRAARPDGDR